MSTPIVNKGTLILESNGSKINMLIQYTRIFISIHSMTMENIKRSINFGKCIFPFNEIEKFSTFILA